VRASAVLLLLVAVGGSGCPSWQAEGGEATVTLFGGIPWTDEANVTVDFAVAGENPEDEQIRCGVRADGAYEFSAFTTFVEELKRLRVAVEVPQFAGTSAYGAEADPSDAAAHLTFREGGEEGWTPDGTGACLGWIDEDSLTGEFTCEGITGSVGTSETTDGPMGFHVAYRCGREVDPQD